MILILESQILYHCIATNHVQINWMVIKTRFILVDSDQSKPDSTLEL